MERELADENISAYERLRFEIEHCGTPISTFADLKNEYAVLDIDNRFSPKVRLYSIATARIGIMKIRKELFKRLQMRASVTAVEKPSAWEAHTNRSQAATYL